MLPSIAACAAFQDEPDSRLARSDDGLARSADTLHTGRAVQEVWGKHYTTTLAPVQVRLCTGITVVPRVGSTDPDLPDIRGKRNGIGEARAIHLPVWPLVGPGFEQSLPDAPDGRRHVLLALNVTRESLTALAKVVEPGAGLIGR